MRVPTYQPQVERQVAPHTPQTTDAYGGTAASQDIALGKGIDNAADGFDQIAQQQANTQAFTAEAQAKKDWIAYSADLQKNRQGVNAAGVTTDVQKWWDDNKAKYGAGQGGRAGRMIDRSMTNLQTQAMEQFKTFEFQQGQVAADAAVQANVSASVSSIAANPSNDNIALQRTGITAALQQHAAARGWAPEVLNDKVATAQSAGTIAAFNTIFARSPTDARDFWAANRETVRGEQRDEIETRLKHGLASVEGNDAVDAVWRDMGPKTDIAPVELDKMADVVRAKFHDQPETLKAALQALHERATEHNAAQTERQANNTNDVMAIWNSTKSLDQMKRSQAWAALPAAQQSKIEEHVDSMLLQNENRALVRSNRDLVEMQKQQQRLQIQGYSKYLELSDPTRLASMSDAQVRALLPELGNELTTHLVEKRRTLANADATRVASIDKQDFDAIAQEMQLRPFEPKADEDHKAALGMLQYRVEQLIDTAQRQKKAPLDRQEKQAIMRNEMAKQVLVGGGPSWLPNWLGGATQKPVISLGPDEVSKVQVPAPDRAAIGDAMRAMYERTHKPQYAPTEDNLRRFYLLRQTPSAALIPSTSNGK